jgi:hypothetical protein
MVIMMRATATAKSSNQRDDSIHDCCRRPPRTDSQTIHYYYTTIPLGTEGSLLDDLILASIDPFDTIRKIYRAHYNLDYYCYEYFQFPTRDYYPPDDRTSTSTVDGLAISLGVLVV